MVAELKFLLNQLEELFNIHVSFHKGGVLTMVKRMIALFFVGIFMFSANSCKAQEEDEFGSVETKTEAAPTAVTPAAAEEKIDSPATIKGKITFDGQKPTPKEIKMDADPNCAALHTEPAFRKDALVAEDGSFANVFVYVKKGLEGKSFAVPTEPVKFDQHGCEYEPRVFGVRAGQPVEIINSDPTLHNVHAMAENNEDFNIGMPVKGMKLKKTFNKPELMVKIVCDVHPWMNGFAGVMEHPYFFTTGKDGAFQLANLPPGDYVIAAWQEKLGEMTQDVKVGANETKEVNFVFTRKE